MHTFYDRFNKPVIELLKIFWRQSQKQSQKQYLIANSKYSKDKSEATGIAGLLGLSGRV